MLPEEHLNDPVSRHMRTDLSRVRVDQTVGEALQSIREEAPTGRIIYFYVVDDAGRLHGVVPTRRLLLSSLDTPIEQIMDTRVVAIPHDATVLDACEFFTLHRLLAFPVVDKQRRLLGLVDVDLYAEGLDDIERTEKSDTLFQLIGVHLIESQQLHPWRSFRSRFPWLLCNIAGGLGAAFLSRIFEAELQQVIALALFIPIVLALAESVSIQSVSLALQVLQGQIPSVGALWAKLRRELITGTLLGAASGVLVGLVALVWLGQPAVALCLVLGILGGVTSAAILGVAIPNVLYLVQRDPQVAAGPVALASADMVTLLLYFSLARWLLT